MLSKTSGEIAKFFNKVFNLEKIDSSQQQIKSKLSDTKKRMVILEEDLKEDEKKLKNFDWIDEAEKKIEKLVEDEIKIDVLLDESVILKSVIYDYEEMYDSYITFDDFENMQEKSEQMWNGIKEIYKLNESVCLLQNEIEQAERYKCKLKKEKAELQRLEKQLHKIMPEVCPLCNQKIL